MTFELPEITDTGIACYPEEGTSKPRYVNCFEIELPMINEGISYINSDKCDISTDMIICAKPGQQRHTQFPFKCYYVHLYINTGFLYDSLIKIPDFLYNINHNKYRYIFEKICSYYLLKNNKNIIALQSLVLELIYVLTDDAEKTNESLYKPAQNCDIVIEALKHITNNLDGDLRLETLAAKFNFSPVHFHNTFKKHTGQTLHKYVEEQRIKKAIDMLNQTNYTLSRIAYECGFSSQSYFNYIFKQYTGYTPRNYLNK